MNYKEVIHELKRLGFRDIMNDGTVLNKATFNVIWNAAGVYIYFYHDGNSHWTFLYRSNTKTFSYARRKTPFNWETITESLPISDMIVLYG